MHYVYIIYSNTINSFYIGEGIDVKVRINQHNSGFYNSSYTKQAKDWALYYIIECSTRTQARKIETHIKKMKSKIYIQNLRKYPEIAEKLKNIYG